jgi:hypothetical protein
MKLIKATKFNRRSGAAEGSAVPGPFLEMFFESAQSRGGTCG